MFGFFNVELTHIRFLLLIYVLGENIMAPVYRFNDIVRNMGFKLTLLPFMRGYVVSMPWQVLVVDFGRGLCHYALVHFFVGVEFFDN